MRAAKQIGLWIDGKVVLPEGDEAAEMMSDIARVADKEGGDELVLAGAVARASTPPRNRGRSGFNSVWELELTPPPFFHSNSRACLARGNSLLSLQKGAPRPQYRGLSGAGALAISVGGKEAWAR